MAYEIQKLTDATRMLAECKIVSEVKDIRDIAEAARHYAKVMGLGTEASNHATEIKLRAERKLGEMLGAQKKARPGPRPQEKIGNAGVTDLGPPTLAEIGISKMQSSRWQQVAELPEETFEQHIAETKARGEELTSVGVRKLAKKEKRKRQQVKTVVSEELFQDTDTAKFICGNFAEIAPTLEQGSFDAIITDPPYPQEYLYLYGILAEQAAYLLKPGGSLLAMAGQSYLPDIFNLMTPHLDYNWTVAYLTPGGQSAQLWQRKVNSFWKPVLWFTNGGYTGKWVGDVAKSNVNDNDKRFHDWGQSESGMADLVNRFSKPGDLILDPFCGGGTTAVVCHALSRHFVGIDISSEAIEISKQRMVIR